MSKFKLHLRRGLARHATLRKTLCAVKTLSDMKNSYVSELADHIEQLLPNISSHQSVNIKAEVPILNRRPDFLIHIPNKALILLEYKTSVQTLCIRSSYLKQTLDTFRKVSLQNRRQGCDSMESIKLISLLLIRNPSSKQNRVICLKVTDIGNRPFFFE